MIFFIILVLAIVLGCILSYSDYGDVVFGALFGAGVGILFGVVALLIVSSLPGEKVYELDSAQNIVAMVDGQNTSGSFYLFGGTVKDEFVYRYAYEDEMGIRVKDLDADDCVITYTDEQPQIEKYYVYYKNPVHRFLACPDTSYRFLVPEGTVTTEYVVDLK